MQVELHLPAEGSTDAASFTRTLLAAALSQGAQLLQGCRAIGLTETSGQITGIRVRETVPAQSRNRWTHAVQEVLRAIDAGALAAQRLGGTQATQSCADDDDLRHQAEISIACMGQTSAAAST